MPAVGTGFASLRTEHDRLSAQRINGGFIPYMRLRDDNDIVRFRILSAHEESYEAITGIPSTMLYGYFHRYSQTSATGKQYFTSTICGKEEDENGNLIGECPLCDQDIRRSLQFMVWVYVYSIYHERQNTDSNNLWPRGEIGAMVVYEEKVNKYMIWQDGFFSFQALGGKLQRYETLNDRDYERIRHGVRGTQAVRYDLESLDPNPMNPAIIQGAQNLPKLIDVALGKTRTMDGGRNNDSNGVAPVTSISYSENNNNQYDEIKMSDLPF